MPIHVVSVFVSVTPVDGVGDAPYLPLSTVSSARGFGAFYSRKLRGSKVTRRIERCSLENKPGVLSPQRLLQPHTWDGAGRGARGVKDSSFDAMDEYRKHFKVLFCDCSHFNNVNFGTVFKLLFLTLF